MGGPIPCWTDTDIFFLSPGISEVIRIHTGIHFRDQARILIFLENTLIFGILDAIQNIIHRQKYRTVPQDISL